MLFPLHWKDVVDILVISFILHRIFLLMRGTAVIQIAIGLASLWIFQELARTFGLVLTSWFFRGVSAIFVLVIVVVFHAEIREILTQTNPVRFLLGRSRQTGNLGYHLIGQALFRLARRRTGALVVIQNLDELGSHTVGGFPLDGNLIPEVLEGLFAKDSPVHDGAVVIQGNRIARVGTFLPLSQSEELPQYFGTRHRAAVGLSELCDAVILVVSEERGEISLVHRRDVHRIRDPEQLENMLAQLILMDRKVRIARTSPRFPRFAWLSQAGGLVATILLVSLFWGIYAGGRTSMLPLRVPVQFRNIPSDMQLTEASTQEVEVQIRGKRGLVSSLDPQQVKAFVNLAGIGTGEHDLPLKAANFTLPPGLAVEQITPSSITFHMGRVLEKTLEVKPELVGPPPAGYSLVDARVRPLTVRARGPDDILRDLASLKTSPILLRELKVQDDQAVLEAALDVSPSVQLVDLPRRRVEVHVRFGVERTPPGEPVTWSHLVQQGDTLYQIGRRYGVSVDVLRQANNLKPNIPIHPGQILRIPAP